MGKIRIKTLGDENLEEKEKKETKKKHEARLASEAQRAKRTTKAPGQKGGERVVAISPTEEELEKIEVKKEPEETKEKSKKSITKKGQKRVRSARYKSSKIQVEKQSYSLSEALELLKKMQGQVKFDETVELHVNTIEKGISGNVTLPHGKGKETRVAIADDKLIAEIEKGKINFDVLVAEPQMMPKLAKVAKVLGPRGLMPNPKNGTISQNPKELLKKYEGGQIAFKTEAKAPIIHLVVGKASFENKKLKENIETVLGAIKKQNIKKAVLKSTMSPGIKLEL